MASPSFSLLLITLSFFSSDAHGFTVDLIHRDSPLSPFYNPTQSDSDRVMDAARRSMSRIRHFNPSSTLFRQGGAESVLNASAGEYLMNITIGTPPFKIEAIADTGSDLIWTQCKPCVNCFEQRDPIFNSKNSSTYRNLACESPPCRGLSQGGCDAGRRCVYSYGYGDRSYTKGNLATETVRLGPVSIPKATFGCGRDNGGNFVDLGSGIIGLGGGPLSLVTQLGSVSAGKFSYCLVPITKKTTTSKIIFGGDAVVSGKGVVSTPLIPKKPDTFYYLTLEAVSVGNKKLPFSTKKLNQTADEGNIIIDSGTTLTLLPAEMLSGLVEALKEAISGEPAVEPSGTFSLCYRVSEGSDELEIPDIRAHFTGGDVVLKPVNTFILVDEGLVCLAMIGANDLAIYGNLAQMDFLVGYDIEKKTVSFKPTDCTNY